MSSLVSAISGQFNKALILATLFPVVFFGVLAVVLLAPFVPANWPVLTPLQALDPQWQVIVLSLLAVVISGLLYNFNTPIIRIYEGYPWKDSWIGVWKTRGQRARRRWLLARDHGLTTLLLGLGSADPNYAQLNRARETIQRSLVTEFPDDDNLVLPTRLGNVIRGFEYYAFREYNMDAVMLWPRLVAKIDPTYAAVIDDSKMSFDFMLNCSFLSGALALVVLVLGLLLGPTTFVTAGARSIWLIEVPILLGVGWLFYLGSISRAAAWGTTVKSAFDLYRSSLLSQLGYKQQPTTRFDERQLWQRISQQVTYGDVRTAPDRPHPRLDYAGPIQSTSAFALGNLYTVRLEMGRGVLLGATGELTISIRVHNVDQVDAQDVVVVDSVPDGLEYQWGSAKVRKDTPLVMGTNPYIFHVGNINAGAERLLTYLATPRKKS